MGETGRIDETHAQDAQGTNPDSATRADLERSFDLLWGGHPPAVRGPKPGLTLEVIARAGMTIADEQGLEAVSMRAIAERLGFTTMSLYRYVPAKSDLMGVILEMAIGDALPRVQGRSGTWRERLANWARESRQLFRRHPWMQQVALPSALLGPMRIAWIEAGLDAVAELGLDPPDALEAVLAIYAYVYGVARLNQEWRDDPGQEGWNTDSPLMQRISQDPRFPHMQALVRAGYMDVPEEVAEGDPYADTEFEFGLTCLLDGIAARAAAKAR
jgi:AcrR family transcriptional regulator